MEVEDLISLQRRAAHYFRQGDVQLAVEVQKNIIDRILEKDINTVKENPELSSLLRRTSSQFIDFLRWLKEYEQGISLQMRLLEVLPANRTNILLGIANLTLESGRTQEGIQLLKELVESDPENIWTWLSLGAAYIWIKETENAEEAFCKAVSLKKSKRSDRALAQKYLFDLYAGLGDMDKALEAWNESCRLSPKMVSMLPEVCRWLIYWRRFQEAEVHIQRDTLSPRRLFFKGLLAWRQGNFIEANGQWKMLLVDYDPLSVQGAEDEYGEACLYLVNPSSAIVALEHLADKGQINYYRMVILGLAWAQKRALDRALWYLDVAIRLGDLQRPRRTRAAPQGQILDIHARRFYGDIVIDKDIRSRLDKYFIPSKTLP